MVHLSLQDQLNTKGAVQHLLLGLYRLKICCPHIEHISVMSESDRSQNSFHFYLAEDVDCLNFPVRLVSFSQLDLILFRVH